jgi:hypothetical protein
MVMILENVKGFSANQLDPLGGPGWARSTLSIQDRAAGAAIDKRRGRVYWSTVDQAKGVNPDLI